MGVSPPLLPHPEGSDPPRSSKRSGVPLKREGRSLEVLFQGVEGFSSFLKRKGEGLEVLFFSLFLFPSRRRSERSSLFLLPSRR